MIKRIDGLTIGPWFLEHWNQEFSLSFPISYRLWMEKIINQNALYQTHIFGMEADNRLIGLLVLKHYQIDDMPKQLYISLIYVIPSYRRKGYGSSMLQFSQAWAWENHFLKLMTGTDPNCLFSGIPFINNQPTHDFFLKRGFSTLYKNMNLICTTSLTIPYDPVLKVVKTEAEKQAVLQLIKNHFSKRWLLDVMDAQPEEFVIVKKDEEMMGFLRINHESCPKFANSLNLYQKYPKLGGIGPLGIIPNYRNLGLGKKMVRYAINHLFNLGCTTVLVDWTGLVTFYQNCGFSQISQEYIIYQFETGGRTV
ncbi:MAG: GNAT family N-acetyltransferase [Bacilli bacterium]